MQNGDIRLKRIASGLPDGARSADWIEKAHMVISRGKVINRQLVAHMFRTWNGKLYLKVDEDQNAPESRAKLVPGVYFNVSKGAHVSDFESLVLQPGMHDVAGLIRLCRLTILRENNESTWATRKKVLRAVSDLYKWIEVGVYEIIEAPAYMLCRPEPSSIKIRRPDFVSGGITESEAAKLKKYVASWMMRASRTESIETRKLIPAIKNLYRTLGLKEPRIVVASNPLVLAIAGSFAAALWHVRKNGAQEMESSHKAFDRIFSNEVYEATVQTAFHSIEDFVEYETEKTFESLLDNVNGAATRRSINGAAGSALESAASDAVSRDWISVEAIGEFGRSLEAAIFHATCTATEKEGLFPSFKRAPVLRLERLAEILSEGNLKVRDFMMICANDCRTLLQTCQIQRYDECLTSALREVFGLQLPADEKFKAWQAVVTKCGAVLMHEEFCIVSDFPQVLNVDSSGRPHSNTGPSYVWKDGWALYHWHGVRVNRQIIEHPETLTVEDIKSERSLEVRRLMLDRYGIKRYLMDSDAKEIHRDECGVLYSQEIHPALEPIVMVKVINATPEPDGSVKNYFLRVPPFTPTARAAVAWTFGMTAEEYSPAVQT